ncbi:pentapeptide repeat-containing protein, partial [Roseovarius mucosus]
SDNFSLCRVNSQWQSTDIWDWRFTLAQLAALTTVLGAVIALPITINRLILTRRQTDTVEQGHITDRINKAVEGLGATKLTKTVLETPRYRKKDGEWIRDENGDLVPAKRPDGQDIIDREVIETSEPNLEVRIGAIYALERIAQDSARDHIQIMEILCAYIRQNAPADTAEPLDVAGLNSPEIYARLEGGSTPRVDIQAAISVLARRKAERVESEKLRKYRLDLRGCNLQNVDFGAGAWENAIFDKSSLDQAMLACSNLENASFDSCSFEKTDFKGAILTHISAKGATFRYVRISEDNENVAILNNVDKLAAKFDRCRFESLLIANDFHATILSNSTFIWCQFTHDWFFAIATHKKLESCHFNGCSIRNLSFRSGGTKVEIDRFFGDGSVTLSDGMDRPQKWPIDALDDTQFQNEWRKWQFDPENYVPPVAS